MDAAERRFQGRRPVAENRVTILWDGAHGPLETPARLVDICREGAGFVSESPPPAGRDVRFRLEAPRATGWVQARVVRSDGSTGGGLFFARHFPHDLFASLI